MNIHSRQHRNMISMEDIPIKLTRIEDNKIFQPMYLNIYDRVYYFTEDDNVIFINDDCLNKYKIEYLQDYLESEENNE